jgi:hypothetical protein
VKLVLPESLYKTPPALCALVLVVKVQPLNVVPDEAKRIAPPAPELALDIKLHPLTLIDGLFPS